MHVAVKTQRHCRFLKYKNKILKGKYEAKKGFYVLHSLGTHTDSIQLVVTKLKTFYYCLSYNVWQLPGWERLNEPFECIWTPLNFEVKSSENIWEKRWWLNNGLSARPGQIWNPKQKSIFDRSNFRQNMYYVFAAMKVHPESFTNFNRRKFLNEQNESQLKIQIQQWHFAFRF